MAVESVSTSVKVRFSREFLAFVETWAADHGMTRSKAIRVMMLKGLGDAWADCSGADQ